MSPNGETSEPAWRRRLRRLASIRSRDDVREVAGRALTLADRRLHPGFPVRLNLDYPPSARPGPRYGYGRPRHEQLASILGKSGATYRAELESFRPYVADLVRIPARDAGPGEPCWLNAWFPPLDTVALYGYLRKLAPRQYVEVGSGFSTTVAHRARRDAGLATRIRSIDPAPRRDIDALCDDLRREPLEALGTEPFEDLQAGDVVFFDGSHRVFENSDVVVFYLEVLPALPDGVVVGIHDVLWPDDYLPEWTDFWWSEQYLLGAYLLGGAAWLEPLLSCALATSEASLASVLGELWAAPQLAGVPATGSGFWMRIAADRRQY